MFNKVILVGNLTRDVEVKFTASNLAIGSAGIATNRKFKNHMGENKEEVMFLDITFIGRTAEIANQYLKKGSKVLVEGRLKFDKWTDSNGEKRSKHSLVVESMKMLGRRGEEENLGQVIIQSSEDKPLKHVTQSTQEVSFSDEDIPF